MQQVICADCAKVLPSIVKDASNPIIVTDPPFNVGYHYGIYADRMPRGEWLSALSGIAALCPSVFILYPEDLHALSIEIGKAPDRVVTWVYPSNTKRQHRDIGFYGLTPRFENVRRPYRNPNDKRVMELVKRTGGARSYDWLEVNQVKNVSKEKTGHPCQMPLAVMRDVIGWLGRTDVTVIDPFAGSGSTAVACAMCGVDCISIEIDPDYCRIIEQRLAQFKEEG